MLINSDSARIPLPDKSIHCVTTSPPYWGLRKYSGGQGRIWDGDPECAHEWGNKIEKKGITGGKDNPFADKLKIKGVENYQEVPISHSQFCQLCGAWYGGLGLEPTPDLFIQHMVEIFREVRRVLRDDGVVWMNLGDCFAGSGGENANTGLTAGYHSYRMTEDKTRSNLYRNNPRQERIAQGNLMLMPHRVAIALQDDGWIVRNDLIWYKRNPMPESVNGWRFQGETCQCKRGRAEEEIAKHVERTGADRRLGFQALKNSGLYDPDPNCPECGGSGRADDFELRKGSWRHTRAHEYVFQLTKKMQYWSNQEAARIPYTREWDETNIGPNNQHNRTQEMEELVLGRKTDPHGNMRDFMPTSSGANPRSVLDVPTAPYKGAHYATFPPNLIAPLIRATCPRWACPVCGQGWSPVVEKGEVTGIPGEGGDGYKLAKAQSARDDHNIKGRSEGWTPNHFIPSNVKSYRPTCEHPHTIEETVPGIVLDPFVGSGTTVQVAKQLLRRGIGLDISMDYLDEQAKIRTGAGSPSNVLDGLPLFERINHD